MFGKPLTGTERFATEILRELAARHPGRLEIHVPAGIALPEWVRPIKVVRSKVGGPLFDQLAVPIKTIGKTLVNLSGPTTVLKRKQLSVVHDASVLGARELRAPVPIGLQGHVLGGRPLHRDPRHGECVQSIGDRERYGGRARRFVVVSCGSDHAERIRAVPPSVEVPEPYVVCIGSLTRRKNLRPFASRGRPQRHQCRHHRRGRPELGLRWRLCLQLRLRRVDPLSRQTHRCRDGFHYRPCICTGVPFSLRGFRSSGRGGAAEGMSRDRCRDLVAAGGAWRALRSVLPAGLAAEGDRALQPAAVFVRVAGRPRAQGTRERAALRWARSAVRLAGMFAGLAPPRRMLRARCRRRGRP